MVNKNNQRYRSICGVASCSQECHRKWGNKLAAAFALSWREPGYQPDYAIRLSVAGQLSDSEHMHAQKKYCRRLSKRGVEYVFFREWAKPGKPFHTHGALIWGDVVLTHTQLSKWWHECLPDKRFYKPVYAAPIENLVGFAKYLPKAVNRHYCLPPRCFEGKTYFRSRGFLYAPVDDLWTWQIKQWYPD